LSAKTFFDEARKKYIQQGRINPGPLTPEQAEALGGVAAANIGLKLYDEAEPRLDILLKHDDRSRSTAINASIVTIQRGKIAADSVPAVNAMQSFIGGAAADDEYAADVFGTLLTKVSGLRMDDKTRTSVEQAWGSYDTFVDRLAGGTGPGTGAVSHAGQLKW